MQLGPDDNVASIKGLVPLSLGGRGGGGGGGEGIKHQTHSRCIAKIFDRKLSLYLENNPNNLRMSENSCC